MGPSRRSAGRRSRSVGTLEPRPVSGRRARAAPRSPTGARTACARRRRGGPKGRRRRTAPPAAGSRPGRRGSAAPRRPPRSKSGAISWMRQGREVCAVLGRAITCAAIHTVAYTIRYVYRCTGVNMAAPTRTPRTSWIEEGLRALAAGGPDAVRVEALAQALGVTKGGFYWHFDDRRRACSRRCSTRGSARCIDEVIETRRGRGRGRQGQAAAPVRSSPARATSC